MGCFRCRNFIVTPLRNYFGQDMALLFQIRILHVLLLILSKLLHPLLFSLDGLQLGYAPLLLFPPLSFCLRCHHGVCIIQSIPVRLLFCCLLNTLRHCWQ